MWTDREQAGIRIAGDRNIQELYGYSLDHDIHSVPVLLGLLLY